MYASIRRLSIALGLILGFGASGTAFADKPKQVRLKTYKTTERQLGKGIEGVTYSDKSYKFSRATKIRLKEDHTLVLTAWSSDFQPTIAVRKSGKSKVLKRGKYDPVKSHEGTDWYVTRIEFQPPDRGTFIVTISTKGIDQGSYFTEGAIYGWEKPKPVAEEPEKPSATNVSTKGYEYEARKPMRNKRSNWVGGSYTKDGKYAADIGTNWLEGGNTIDTVGMPTDPKKGYGKVARREGNVFYFEPTKTKDYKTGRMVIRRYKVMIFHPEKEIYAYTNVDAKHAASIPAFVKKAQALFDEYVSKARPKP